MQIVLRKRLPGLVATGLSAVWLASAHLLAQAALAVPLTMVKVLLAYHPLRIHLWVSLGSQCSLVSICCLKPASKSLPAVG